MSHMSDRIKTINNTDSSGKILEGSPLSASKLKIDWLIVSWFIILHVAALTLPFFYTTPGAIASGFVLYVATGCFGITLGYHRLLTHRTFKAPRWLERTLATIGVVALQRGPLEWVADHRMHHAGVDSNQDPHNARKGFWWSHIWWMCYHQPQFQDSVKLRRFARDIVADPYLMFINHPVTQVALQLILAAALYAMGGFAYVVWGIFVRLAFVYHCTWFVNSATHKFGYKRYESNDLATNCWWVALLTFGEGWHNNHHTHQDVAPAGHTWYEIDFTWYIIVALKNLGLATDIKGKSVIAP